MKTTLALLMLVAIACSSSSQPESVYAACTLEDSQKIESIMSGSGSGPVKFERLVVEVGPDILACVARKKATEVKTRAPAPGGSFGGSATGAAPAP